MQNIRLTLAALFAVLLLAGCASTVPIADVDASPVPAGASRTQVRDAIGRAGASLGWVIRDEGTGKASGTLNLRTHTAVVDIPYSNRSYDIRYRESSNLKAEDGNIHKNYNTWVQNLDKRIQRELSAS